MNKTLKEIAEDLKIDKQKVYRFVKKEHIAEVLSTGSAKQYDDAAQKKIISHFQNNEPHHKSTSESHHDAVYETLLKQLEIKDNQIAEMQKLLNQEQQLRMITEQKILALEDKNKKKKWWHKKDLAD